MSKRECVMAKLSADNAQTTLSRYFLCVKTNFECQVEQVSVFLCFILRVDKTFLSLDFILCDKIFHEIAD